MPGNFIWQIVEDARHDVWVAVKDGGLARWSRAKDAFTVYRHEPGDQNSLASDAVRAVLVDSRGLVWVGTSDAGVDILDPVSGRIEHLPELGNVFALTQARSGDVWIGTDAGLRLWHAATRAVSHFAPDVLRGPTGHTRARRSERRRVGGQLRRRSHPAGSRRAGARDLPPRSAQYELLSSNDVRALLEDQDGHFWVGTAEGLDLLDRTSGEVRRYQHDANDADSLRDSFVMSLYQDQGGLVWIGTRVGGVSRWSPRSWQLGGHRPAWLGSASVTAFADAVDNQVWIASQGSGLVRFNADSGAVTPLDDIVRRRNALGDPRVMSLRQDAHGTLWIGTMTSGLKKLTPEGRLESIPVKAGDPRATSAEGITHDRLDA